MLVSRHYNITSEFQQDVIKVVTVNGMLNILKGLWSESSDTEEVFLMKTLFPRTWFPNKAKEIFLGNTLF